MRIDSKTRYLLIAVSLFIMRAAACAQVGVFVGFSIHTAPPVLPLYAQPPCSGDGYLRRPDYWGLAGGVYGWYPGRWGPHVGPAAGR
jgi:hypothetical protein